MKKSNKTNKIKILYMIFGFLIVLGMPMGSHAFAADAEVMRLSDSGTGVITISGRGTVLSFPMKPTKVILGKANSFGIEYCDNDLAISPLTPTARSHLYVYLYGRRFSFDLITSMDGGRPVILVRDAKDVSIKVKTNE